MEKYIGLVAILIFVFLLLRYKDQAKTVINSLSSANLGAIVALQGGNASRFTNGVGG